MGIIITIIICTLAIIGNIVQAKKLSMANQLTIANNQAIISEKLEEIKKELKKNNE